MSPLQGQWAANYVVSQLFPMVMDSEALLALPGNVPYPIILYILSPLPYRVCHQANSFQKSGKSLEEIEICATKATIGTI
jgi:SP family xylose:H+ symportor-like MFS transporter